MLSRTNLLVAKPKPFSQWQNFNFSVNYQLDSRLENLTPVIIHRLGEEGVGGFCLCHNKIYPLISHKALLYSYDSTPSPSPLPLFYWQAILLSAPLYSVSDDLFSLRPPLN